MATDVAWLESGNFKPQAPTLPSVPTRHEAMIYIYIYIGSLKVSPPALVIGCFLVLATSARGAPLTKIDGKIGE